MSIIQTSYTKSINQLTNQSIDQWINVQWINEFSIYTCTWYIHIETGEGSYLRLMLDWKMTWSQSWVQFTHDSETLKKRSQWAAASMARSESHLYPGTSKKNGRNVLQKVFVQRFHFPVNTSLQWGLFSPPAPALRAHATQDVRGAGEIASVFESTNCDGGSIGGIPSCRLWVCPFFLYETWDWTIQKQQRGD